VHETTVFAGAPWYRERTEPEVRWEGMLAPHSRALGPGSRGGLDFVLQDAGTDLAVYSAGVEALLRPFDGRRVVVWGKRVDVDGTVELWPGRIAAE
jgi:hypothetical protein